MDIREICCLRAAWVYGDNPRARFYCTSFPNHLEENRVIRCHIRADNQKDIRVLDIVIAGRRTV